MSARHTTTVTTTQSLEEAVRHVETTLQLVPAATQALVANWSKIEDEPLLEAIRWACLRAERDLEAAFNAVGDAGTADEGQAPVSDEVSS